MVKAKVFVFAKPFEGGVKVENFSLVEEELPALKDGGEFCFFRVILQ